MYLVVSIALAVVSGFVNANLDYAFPANPSVAHFSSFVFGVLAATAFLRWPRSIPRPS